MVSEKRKNCDVSPICLLHDSWVTPLEERSQGMVTSSKNLNLVGSFASHALVAVGDECNNL